MIIVMVISELKMMKAKEATVPSSSTIWKYQPGDLVVESEYDPEESDNVEEISRSEEEM